MKKTVIYFIIICIILAIVGMVVYKVVLDKEPNKEASNPEPSAESKIDKPEAKEGLYIVPTMQDAIAEDSLWCGTFQLVWNDMKNEVVKQDVAFNPQEEMATNLNKEEFKADMLSEEYYYKKWGFKSLELKQEIEEGIKEKFNQESDILNDFDWSEGELNNPNDPSMDRYFFYVMLYRKFEFLQVFDKLDKGTFGEEYSDISYFGINSNTKEEVGEQIKVLYYKSQNDFAISIKTKTNDEVIVYKNPQGTTFKEMYDNLNKEASIYEGNTSFAETDEFKVPNLTFNEKREYTELENKPFATEKGHGVIVKAIQTIRFSLDEKGGEIKSEAGIDMKNLAAVLPTEMAPRYFYLDDTFAIFLKEEGKDVPYFAGRIEDITKFQ